MEGLEATVEKLTNKTEVLEEEVKQNGDWIFNLVLGFGIFKEGTTFANLKFSLSLTVLPVLQPQPFRS